LLEVDEEIVPLNEMESLGTLSARPNKEVEKSEQYYM
jgi:hypothetical protein